jgi:hypothetical protein
MYRDQFIARPEPGSAIRAGWDALKTYFLEFLLATLVIIAVSAISSLFTRGSGFGSAGISFLINIFVTGPVSFGVSYYFLKAMRGDAFELGDIFTAFRENYLQVVLANFLMMMIIGLGFVLLIIPGIILLVRLAFVPYLVMDEKLDAVEAIRASWDLTRDHGMNIFLLVLVSVFIMIGGLILLVIGVIPAAILVQAAFAAFYLGVRDEYDVVDETAAPDPEQEKMDPEQEMDPEQ